jgi:type I restriction enzyme M protein
MRGTVIPRLTSAALGDVLVPPCDGSNREITSAVLRLRECATEVSHIRAMLDESRDKIFENGTSAERRTRLTEAAELSLLTAQNLRKQQEPYRAFQQSYPYGIARAVRRFRHSASARERHETALQCAESLILSLGIVSLAAAADRHWVDVEEVVAWSEAVQRGGVSLGHWLGVIRGVGAMARRSRDGVAGLADATATRKGGKGLISDLDELVTLRNKVRHGGGPRTPAEVGMSLQIIEPLLSRSLVGSSFLSRSDWVYPLKLRWTQQTGGFHVSGLAVMGDHPDFEPIEFEAGRPMEDARLCLVDRNRDWFLLEPFCVLEDCPSCLTPELYYPDRLKGRTALLKSLDRGHELESEIVFAALTAWLSP